MGVDEFVWSHLVNINFWGLYIHLWAKKSQPLNSSDLTWTQFESHVSCLFFLRLCPWTMSCAFSSPEKWVYIPLLSPISSVHGRDMATSPQLFLCLCYCHLSSSLGGGNPHFFSTQYFILTYLLVITQSKIHARQITNSPEWLRCSAEAFLGQTI